MKRKAFTMKRLLALLSSYGAKGPIEHAAPTQHVKDENTASSNVTGYADRDKERALDRWLDRVVKASGSEPVFLFIVAGLVVWAFLGIKYGHTADWAVLISDIQAIVSYVFDSLLMRQQLNEYEKMVRVSASLRSRAISNRRMLRALLNDPRRTRQQHGSAADQQLQRLTPSCETLPPETLVDRLSTAASRVVGHLVAVCLYWVCIAVWLGFGPFCDWSNGWQLAINSATSALMVFIFAFLANVQERHAAHVERCLNAIFEHDSAVERVLRAMTGDDLGNETVVVVAPRMSRIQRAILYYADLVGTLTGIAILTVVMIVWLAIGPVMGFSSNWWLLIGTYAGLVGLNDSFVLRNVQMLFHGYAQEALDQVDLEDKSILDQLRLPDPAATAIPIPSEPLTYRISAWMGVICAHEATVIVGFVFILGLLAGASAMRWSTAGQLLCNIPPSIIETFFMMILITGHNQAETKRHDRLERFFMRRSVLLSYCESRQLQLEKWYSLSLENN
ncbi:low affinity iron transporter [Ophiocordyceps camponoti-floridani]|uniref:Low affinity iron transporter n=1 Tax=Ophiocordyceps camponoti-floridani TaxID=2030778 RepID=A0A8H4VE64_9HYPO|nr:low affinity iron transporter [Ophiocordyceps camponoti-floridani]